MTHSHAASYRPALQVTDLKEIGEVDETPTADERFKELNKLKADELKAFATELGVEFESDANKATVANAIIAKEAEVSE